MMVQLGQHGQPFRCRTHLGACPEPRLGIELRQRNRSEFVYELIHTNAMRFGKLPQSRMFLRRYSDR